MKGHFERGTLPKLPHLSGDLLVIDGVGYFPTFDWVVATQIVFLFIPKIGEMIQFDEHIFQMG